MSGHRPVNLVRRKNGVFYFRGYVPRDMRAAVHRRELRVSLRTSDAARARLLAQRVGLGFGRFCERVRHMIHDHAPDHDIQRAVQAFGYAMLKAAMPPPSFAGPDIDRDFAYAAFCAEEQLAALERAVRDNDCTPTEIDVEDALVHSGALANGVVAQERSSPAQARTGRSSRRPHSLTATSRPA